MSRQPSQPFSQESLASSSQPNGSQSVGPDGFRVPTNDRSNRGEIIRYSSQNEPTHLSPGSPFLSGSQTTSLAYYGDHWARAGSVSFPAMEQSPFFNRESSMMSDSSGTSSIRGYSRASDIGRPSQTPTPSRVPTVPLQPPRFRWDDNLDAIMLRVLTENAARGRKADNSFKGVVFGEVVAAINAQPVLRPVDHKMCQGRLAYVCQRRTNDQ